MLKVQEHTPKNSWKIELISLENERFDETHFVCKCGNHQSVSYHKGSDPVLFFRCRMCGNDVFHDHDRFLNTAQHLVVNEFLFSCVGSSNEEGYSVDVCYNFPLYRADEDSFSWEYIPLYTIAFSHDGAVRTQLLEGFAKQKPTYNTQTNQASKLESILFHTAKKGLGEYMLANIPKEIAHISAASILATGLEPLDIFGFLLRHAYVQEADLALCGGELFEMLQHPATLTQTIKQIAKEKGTKSVLRALFMACQTNKNDLKYELSFDYAILETFEDPNFLVPLISQTIAYKKYIFEGIGIRELAAALRSLHTFYTQKELYSLFVQASRSVDSCTFFRDSLRIISLEGAQWFEAFYVKENNSLTSLHEILVFLQNSKRQKYSINPDEPFVYENFFLEAQTKHDDLNFKLPKTPKELQEWARGLKNCMFSYMSMIIKRQTTIYGVYKEEKLLYALEIRNNQIVQVKASCNRPLSAKEMQKIEAWGKRRCVSHKVV
ncbi:MAG: PcfJ domain-containing protein [Bacilli bacterium]|nr:PcfJ domain-containing protein [Bacilli bacterium]